jgi:hypothetical protein
MVNLMTDVLQLCCHLVLPGPLVLPYTLNFIYWLHFGNGVCQDQADQWIERWISKSSCNVGYDVKTITYTAQCLLALWKIHILYVISFQIFMAGVNEMMVGFGFCTVQFNMLPLHSAEPKGRSSCSNCHFENWNYQENRETCKSQWAVWNKYAVGADLPLNKLNKRNFTVLWVTVVVETLQSRTQDGRSGNKNGSHTKQPLAHGRKLFCNFHW